MKRRFIETLQSPLLQNVSTKIKVLRRCCCVVVAKGADSVERMENRCCWGSEIDDSLEDAICSRPTAHFGGYSLYEGESSKMSQSEHIT